MTPTTPVSRPSDRWSLDSFFSAFGAADYGQFKDSLRDDLVAFLARLDGAEHVDAASLAAFESLSARLGHISAFLGALSADDANNDAVKADEAWLARTVLESAITMAIRATGRRKR